MDDGVLEGVKIISLIGNSERLDVSLLKDSKEERIEECVRSLCRLGIVVKKNNFLYLTVNGQKIYEKLQKQYI